MRAFKDAGAVRRSPNAPGRLPRTRSSRAADDTPRLCLRQHVAFCSRNADEGKALEALLNAQSTAGEAFWCRSPRQAGSRHQNAVTQSRVEGMAEITCSAQKHR